MPEPVPSHVPERVREAGERAAAIGFEHSSEPGIGRVLMTLAAAVRPGGRILEIGTGMGVGTAWLVEGLATRTDVELVTIEFDPQRARLAAEAPWPPFVRPVVGDALVELGGLGTFSLVFADAEGGKLYGLDLTMAAVETHGLLILDDRRFQGRNPAIEEGVVRARRQLLADHRFVCAEMNWSSGVLLATRVE
ncbi:MAG: class I SAM-dependent methyltransferase [Candidatus Limnocylindrales bacterium]|jgi:demethylmenaquinone methyltransferase/2-methoxy-6-polyprenyl-1,4-benzoquinol methylase